MLIKQVKFRLPRTKFATRIIFIIIFIILLQTFLVLRIQSPENVDINTDIGGKEEKIDLSYADIDIDNIENQAIEDLSNGKKPESDESLENDQFNEDDTKDENNNNAQDEEEEDNDNNVPQEQNLDGIENEPENPNEGIEPVNDGDDDNKESVEQPNEAMEEANKEEAKEGILPQEGSNEAVKEATEEESKEDLPDEMVEAEKNEKEMVKEEQSNHRGSLENVNKEEADKIFNKDEDIEKTKPKGWKLDKKWEWCRNISIVYTWVNGSDPHHQEIKSHYNGGIKKVDQRDRSMDELRYSLRSLEKNLPWHEGMIYIVSPNQTPSWLNIDHPRIKVIDQASLLPPESNPTFNSFSIEFYLDKIPGLTERFIQLNDDYFFKRYIHPSFFFNQKKYPNFYFGRTHVNKGFKEAYQIAALEKTTWLKKYWGSVFHSNGVIKEKYGEEAQIIMLQHAPYVWYRDIFEPMRQFYGKYISQTLEHKFRHPLDLIPTYAHQQYIMNVASKPEFKLEDQPADHPELDFGFYPHKNAEKWITDYGYRPLSRSAVKNYIRFGTVLDDKKKTLKLFNVIRNGPYLMFNLNDDYTTEEPAEWLLDFMNEMFPNYSLFENDKPAETGEAFEIKDSDRDSVRDSVRDY